MGLWGAISSVVSSAVSTISSVVSNIGSGLSSFSSGVGAVIGTVVESMSPVAKTISSFANIFLQKLGILKPNEAIESMGDRALQAADEGITMDDFDDFDDYMNALRNFEPNLDKSQSYSPGLKLVAGLGVGTKGVENMFNAENGSLDAIWLLPMTNAKYFTPERIAQLIKDGRLGSGTFAYLEKQLTAGETRDFEKALEVNDTGDAMDNDQRCELYEALENAQENWSTLIDKIDGSKP